MASRSRRAVAASAAKKRNQKKSSEDQFMAAAIGDVEWLRQSLREAGEGAPASFDRNGLAAVHLAAIHGRLECLRLLIEQYKCDVNSASSTGWRPVHLCISGQTGPRSLQCLLYLLDKGADHSCTNEDMVTPVHQAASEGHLQALQLLIKLGARLDQADVRGFKPIDMAKIWGHKKCARLLATETWHREKDQVAKKLNMEKRVAMKDLLKQFEREEQVTGDMRYQGNEEFTEWVQHVEETNNAHQRRHRNKSQPQSKPQTPKSLTGEKVAEGSEDGRVSPAERYRQPSTTAQEVGDSRLDERVRQVIDEANEVLGLDGEKSSTRQVSSRPPLRLASHKQDWNYSGKVTDCFHPYQRALEDVYPRDVFTKMPHPRNSFPLRLNAKSGHPSAALAGEFDRDIMLSIGRERDVEEQGAAEDDNKFDVDEEEMTRAVPPQSQEAATFREQLFACRSVLDLQRRRRLEAAARINRGEAAAHLSSDVTSYLFRDALGLTQSPATPEVGVTAHASATSSGGGSRDGSRPSRRSTPQQAKLLSPKLMV